MNRKSISIQAGVAKNISVRRMIGETAQEFTTVNIFCNDAGVSTTNKVAGLSEEEWDTTWTSTPKGCSSAARRRRNYSSDSALDKIINTASIAGQRGTPFLARYGASKFAVIGFSKALVAELAPLGITVNCVCPCLVKTAMQAGETG
jgi:NAD(P)-dependent dehydrogenase (short-subunit alcohol dehydrogenase family)